MKLALQLLQSQEAKKVCDFLNQLVMRTRRVIDGHLGFGDGVDTDNMFGTWVTYVTNAVANTEDTVAHNLGLVPIGWLVFSIDKAAILYKGPTAWTTSSIFLKCNTASTTVLIFVMGPSNQDS